MFKPKITGGPESQSKVFLRRGSTQVEERPFISRARLGPTVQAKLTENAPGDRYEREADRMAAYATRPANTRGERPAISGLRSGAPAPQRREDGASGAGSVSPAIGRQLEGNRGGGRPLPPPVRRQMEGAFHADFSGVRIHTGAAAAWMSRAFNAQAFTLGNDIYFDRGNYHPHTASGGRLLAHELTHTVQQGSRSRAIMRTEQTGWRAGRVDNRFSWRRVLVQYDQGEQSRFLFIEPGQVSPSHLDIDYVQDSLGIWYKIGPFRTIMTGDGFVQPGTFLCPVRAPGESCLDQLNPFRRN